MSTETWLIVGRTADFVTLAAAALAFAGAISTWLTRPRVELSAYAHGPGAATVTVSHVKGSRPVRNLYQGASGLKDDRGWYGDGPHPWSSALYPGDWRQIDIYDPAHTFQASPPRDNETRMPTESVYGVIIDVSWDGPVVPWRRVRRVVLWTHAARTRGEPPTILRGRAARRAWARAHAELPS